MASENHIENILFTLNEAQVDFIICGGLAAVLYGVERMTVDVDISIEFEKDNIERFLSAVKKLGMEPRAPVSSEILFDEKERKKLAKEKNAIAFTFIDQENPYKQIDVFLMDEYDFSDLIKNSGVQKIEGRDFHVISREKLIELKKKAGRDKDLLDIKELEKDV